MQNRWTDPSLGLVPFATLLLCTSRISVSCPLRLLITSPQRKIARSPLRNLFLVAMFFFRSKQTNTGVVGDQPLLFGLGFWSFLWRHNRKSRARPEEKERAALRLRRTGNGRIQTMFLRDNRVPRQSTNGKKRRL
ncbi:hypothetical protein B0H16DRAFT_601704 [Mycena metata]|uniref:Uncharacterized protein n=1 Tax=Mycena metata TaxID=1033252 RepID=A0AAD7NYX4_9AGAR|nr:hypothetical protein B0H16DRAFT_601704 [Mycena metata]